MTTAELVNLIVKKFGGNRVEFLDISNMEHNRRKFYSVVEMIHGGNIYDVRCEDESTDIAVRHIQRDQGPLTITQYSTWVQGVLNGGTRDDAGVVS